jgi:MFS family permease
MNKIFPEGKPQAAVLAAFFACGALMATWVARIPAVQAKLNLSEGGLGLVLLGLSIAVLTALSLSGGLVARYGSRKVTLIGGLGMCAALPLLALAPHPALLFPGLTLFGAAMSSMDVAMNEQAVLVERKAGYALMSSFHASYKRGSAVRSADQRRYGVHPRHAPGAPFSAGFHFLYRHLGFHVPASATHHFRIEGKEKLPSSFPSGRCGHWARSPFVQPMNEIAMADWSGVYLTRVLQTNAAFAALGYAAFSLTMTLGRMFGDWISKKIQPADMGRFGGLLTAAGLVILIITDHPALAIVGCAAVGLGLSNIIPLVYSAAGNIPGIAPGTGIAGVANIGYMGSLVGPTTIGLIANATSLRVSFGMIAGLAVILVLMAGRVAAAHAPVQEACVIEETRS